MARVVGLSYPGGPSIDKAAKLGTPNIPITKPKFHEETLDFSFSGIKTAIINYHHNMTQKGEEINVNDLCASFQNTVVDILTTNTFKAAEMKGVKKVSIAGGVAANSGLRESFKKEAEKRGMEFVCPDFVYCTDNAAMIGAAAYHYYLRKEFSGMDLNAIPYLPIDK